MVLIRRATLLATAVLLIALAPATAAQAGSCPGADVLPNVSALATASQATLCLVNAERAVHGIAPLAQNGQLDAAATAYAARLVAESFFAHQSPDGGTLTDRLTASGYIRRADEWAVGENLAWAQGTLSTPTGVVKAWMDSPGHRANILNRDYTEVGLGAVLGTPGNPAWGATFVHEFGRRDAPRASTGSAAPAAPAAGKAGSSASVRVRSAVARARTATRRRCAKAAAQGRRARGCTARDARNARAARAARAARTSRS